MKTMEQMQIEVFEAWVKMPKDNNGYPKLNVCPFTGVVSIIRSEKEAREELKIFYITTVLFLITTGLFLVWFI